MIPFLSILVLQVGTMSCLYCPQKDESVVPWDSLSPDDQIFLRDKYPDAGQGAICDLCVRSAPPSSFFGRRSLSTLSSAPQSLDSGLQLPSAPLVVSGAATPLATESVEPGVVTPSASGAESSTAATGSATGLQIRAAHLRSTQGDANGQSVCTALLLASFVCAWKTNFLFPARQVTKNEKKIRVANSGDGSHASKNINQCIYHWTTALQCDATAQGPCTDQETKFFFEN